MEESDDEISLEQLDTHKLADTILKHAAESRNEEELKIRVEATLRPILEKWGIQWASYEHRHEISGARKDALYGTVIVEYKTPGKLDIKSEFEKAKEQVKRYIVEEAKDLKFYGRYFGVLLDGFKISFVRFRKNEWEEQDKPFDINAQTVLRFLEAIRGLRRKPIDAQELLLDFGPKSEMSKKVIQVLYETLSKPSTDRTKMLFDDWKRVFSQVCAYSPEKLEGLTDYYGLENQKNVDVEKLLFATHTYYTLLMKLLTSEIVTLFADSLLGSYLKRLEESYYKSKDDMLDELKELEEGGIFATIGIKNFLEADYFAWYLDEWDTNVATSIFEIVKRLLDYEPATVELNPEMVKDLFKRLYQNLVPRDIRHKLGEYFTPDWLAELLLNEVGYDGNPDKRVLDPACGSGTFLVLTIRRLREYADEHFWDRRELLKKITENIRGIDLNPLAVLASKANYLIALSDLLRYRPREGIELPIYLADSISVERKGEWKWETGQVEEEFELYTTEGKFWIAKEVIDKNLLSPVLSIIEQCVRHAFNKEEFERSLSKDISLSKASISSFIRLYEKIYNLEYVYHKNRIWAALLKNSFAPMLIGKFDYVIGNPPWINWETLPEFYRNSTKQLWDNYGLLEKTKGMGLGKVKRDIAMLFVARCFSSYVKEDGFLGFLIPFTTYKTQAGAGFRNYLANKCKVQKVHDLVELFPFEGAINRASLLIIKEGKTEFPVQCVMWSNPRKRGIEQEAELEEVKKTTKQFDMIFTPINAGKSETPWMTSSTKAYEAIGKIIGSSPWYKAHAGVYTDLNAVYWIDILLRQPNGLLIRNIDVPGLKKRVKEIRKIIDPDLIYPQIRGRDVKKWYTGNPSTYILLPNDKTGKTMEHSELKVNYPSVYEYFLEYYSYLINRNGEPYKSKLEPYRKNQLSTAEKFAVPFYWLFNVAPSLADYKVVWKRIAGGITGKAVSFASAVVEPYNDKIFLEVDRPAVPDGGTLILIPIEEKDEAYFISGILNSTPILFCIASYTYELRMETHILQYIKIVKFNCNDATHQKISELSKKAHKLAKKYYAENDLAAQEDLRKVEEEIDKTVARLYEITDEELEEIKKTLRILKEGETDEEETKE